MLLKDKKKISFPQLINNESEAQRYGPQLMRKLEFEIWPTWAHRTCG